MVAALLLPEGSHGAAMDPLAEIIGLAEAAGAEVVDGVTQRLRTPHPRTAFGKGKVREMKDACVRAGADLAVIDFDLTPSQGRNLEEELGVRVVDRTELILDIFANRARTKQAKLQVELAQMEYLRPRLRRMWTHLERTEGAIGTRGPGETQLESDRRMVNQKISDLRRKLKDIDARRHRQATSRQEPTTVSLVGYTNAGKSSLLQRLTGADVYIADQLFATLDTRVRRWKREDGREVLLTDTVGFVRDLPHHLVASFHATLEETINADLLLHVCDAGDPDLELHIEAVNEVLGQLGAGEIPRMMVLNKIDRVEETDRAILIAAHPQAVMTSAHTSEGLPDLEAAVGRILDQWSLGLSLRIPAGAGRLLAEVKRTARVEADEFEGEFWTGRVRMLPRCWNALKPELIKAGGHFEVRTS